MTTPIIAVSGFMFRANCPTMPNFRSMAMEAGAVAALYKPYRPNELVQVISDAIRADRRLASRGENS
jgi:CheY-like chemotaxis protein